MTIEYITKQIESIQDICFSDLPSDLGIQIIPNEKMNNKKNDAYLDISEDGEKNLFIKTNLEKDYEKFIILHEIGHLLLHYNEGQTFSFYLSRYKWKLENEANMFAFLYLLKDEDLDGQNIINIATHKGIPEQIAQKAYDSLQPHFQS